MACHPNRLSAETPAPADVSDWADLVELIALCARMTRVNWHRQLEGPPLNEVQFSLLWLCRLAPADGLSQNELVAALAISPAHISGQVEQLRQRGWLAGQRAASDRRRQLWQLTPSGQNWLARLMAEDTDWANNLNQAFCPENRQKLAELLRELAQSLRRSAPVSPSPRLFDPGAPPPPASPGGQS
jgi:DNA-binding MarR family transcriptional regulator